MVKIRTRVRRRASGIACLVLAAWAVSASAGVSLLGLAQDPAGTTIPNGVPLSVSITAAPDAGESVVSVGLVYRTLAAGAAQGWHTNAMALAEGSTWTGVVPRLPAGNAEYFVTAETDLGSTAATAATPFTVDGELGEARFTDFTAWASMPDSAWTYKGTRVTYTNWNCSIAGGTDQWLAIGAKIASIISDYRKPDGHESSRLYLRNILGAQLISPVLEGGVGTIYYTSCIRDFDASGSVDIQVTTSPTVENAVWETVHTILYTDGQYAEPVPVNRADVRRVRIFRTDGETDPGGQTTELIVGAIVFDNVALSYPPASLGAVQTSVTPPEPDITTPVTVAIDVVPANGATPVLDPAATLSYKPAASTNWTTAAATMAGDQGTVALGLLAEGVYDYFFTVAFDGAAYARDPDGAAGIQPTVDESLSPQTTATNQFTVNTQNTRILALSGDLDFGMVATNASLTLDLVLSNTGNASLTVEEISLPDGYTAVPMAFVIPPSGVVTAKVTFAPAIIQNYDGTLTAVSDMTAGNDTVSLFGNGREAQVITIQPVTGPAAGVRTEALSFSTQAADNYDGTLEYRFDWGDASTSAWAAASSQSHAWGTTGTFSVRAQARSGETLLESAWTAAHSLSITNTRILRLSGDLTGSTLAFGNVQLTKSATKTLRVSNDGTGPIEVTAIAVPAAFAVDVQAFTLQAGGSTNVLVTFAPAVLGEASGTLAITSDALSGVSECTVAGTGIETEFVSTPDAPAGPDGAVRTRFVEFTAYATNLYGHTVRYRFDWGDASTSEWSRAASQQHPWAETGEFHVRAQAQCEDHPEVISEWSAPSTISITNVITSSVSGSLAFGSVATNATKVLPLTVYNTGTAPLTVTAVDCPVGYTATPSAFVLGVGSNQAVTVTFAPGALGEYNGVITVFSDAMNGNDTVNVTGKGIEAEMIFGIAVTGPSEGIRTKTVSFFNASASNNWSRVMQYRFDWGNGATSVWGQARTSYAWQETGVFQVRAQARSQSDPSVVSEWSEPIAVAISDTRILSLGAVDLGPFTLVITNEVGRTNLRVNNTGTGPLSVTNIVFDPVLVFAASPTNFVVAPGGFQDVELTFSPTVAGDYESTLTVLSDKTSGTDTLPITADSTDKEEITTPELTTDVGWYGTTNQAIRFIATAETSFAPVGHTLVYQFDWDDDGMSGWLDNGTQTHAWATFGSRTVEVQARCATDPVFSEKTSVLVAILDNLNVAIGNALNGQPVAVAVTIPETNGVATACAICVRPAGSTATDIQRIPLEDNGDGTWSGTIPSLGAGALEYFVDYSLQGIEGPILWPYDGSTRQAMVSDDLGEVRFADFSSWASDPDSLWNYYGSRTTYTNWFRLVDGGTNRWFGCGGLVANQVADPYKPNGFDGDRYYFRSIQGAYLRSPRLDGGVGTIYFTSVVRDVGHPVTLDIQVTTAQNPDTARWETVKTVEYTGEANFQHAEPVLVNRRDVTYVRFVRTSLNTSDDSNNLVAGALAMENVAISYPPSDAVITEEYLPKPGYPSLDEAITVRCRVTDVDAGYPAINRRVTVWYRLKKDGYSAGPWQSAPMAEIAPDVYEGEIPQQDPGRVYYYYRCDFDGYHYIRDPDGSGAEPANDEDMSPAYGYTEEDAAGNIYYNFPVRLFLSDCEYLSIESPSIREDLRRMSLVDDYTWQGIVSVSGVTNLLWTFQGINGYTDDAVAFEEANRIWGEEDQDFPYPPIAGVSEYAVTNEIQALLEYDGFLLLRITTTNGDYIVKRAVYQDFNTWQADDSHFEESLGKFSVQTFQDDVNLWGADGYTGDAYQDETFQNDAVMENYVAVPTTTDMKWTMEQAQVVAERRTNSTVAANHALRLNQAAAGRIGNSGLSLTEGVEKFTFQARASINDDYYLLYKKPAAMAWTLPMAITTKIRASQLSNAKAYVSVIACFQPGFFTAGSFYEVRLMQDDDAGNGTQARLRLALYRWDDGVPTFIGQGNPFPGHLDAVASEMVVNLARNDGDTAVEATVSYSGQNITFTDSSASRLTGGSIGFRCFDAVPVVSALKVMQGSTTLFANVTDFSTQITASDWYWGGQRADNGVNRWVVSGKTLTRPVATQTLQAYIAPADGSDHADYEKFVAVGDPFSVTSLRYGAFSMEPKRWDESFVQLRLLEGDVPVVVDNLRLLPWRAVTRDAENITVPEEAGVPYEDWDDWLTQQYRWVRDVGGWAVLEGWVGRSAGSTGNEIQFDRSRANTNLVQALVSPVMTNGIGSIAFDYRTSGGPVHFAIERSNEGDPASYTEVTNAVVEAATATRYSVTIRETYNGRIRVRILDDTAPGATLKLDNLVARDYPPRDESDWVAYNVLVTSRQASRLYEGQSCYLNNSPTRDVVGGALDEWAPYVQTPKVTTGIGEIGFWCRVWDIGGTGELELRVCREVDDEEDSFLTNLVVTSSSFEYIQIEPYDIENMVLRIYSSTNAGMSRVCIDEVVMTEPVRAGYEIFDVRLLLDDVASQQPLHTDRVGVEARIGRFLMNPQDIRLYVSYFVGTNSWGVSNWRGYELDPAQGCATLPMAVDDQDDTLYRTTARIPAQAIDQVVQYVVWGTYEGIEGRPVLMEKPSENDYAGRWTNPEWYYPVDLNAGRNDWSPYYFSYSCPPGGVWINEFNYPVKISSEAGNEYVELIGNTGFDIGNWRIEVVAPYESMTDLYRAADIPAGTVLREDVLTEEEIEWGYADYFDVDNDGWSYFVWGDQGMWPEADLENDDDTTYLLPQNGGIRLIRSMGAYEHSIAYGPGDLAKQLADYGYTYIGYKFTLPPVESPLQLQGDGTSVTNFYWYQPSSYTYSPGRINVDQSLSNVVVVTTKYRIYSVINTFGAHLLELNDEATAYPGEEGLEVEEGDKVAITYTAKPWCRIESLGKDGVEEEAAAGVRSYMVTFRDIRQDHSNNVVFALNPDCRVEGISDTTMQSWLAGKYAEARPFDTDGYGLYVEYALDMDPTVNNSLALSITALELDATGRAVVDFVLLDGATPLTAVHPPVVAGEFLQVQSAQSLSNPDWQAVGDGTLSYVAMDGVWRWTSNAALPGNPYLRVRIENP
ncbi:MAG: choice-of-anchor D domain-containing protein [Kiritimatiellia bacterium]